jgi:hypothetical protein
MPLTAAGLALVLVPALRGRTLPRQAWVGYLVLALAGLAKENFVTTGPTLCLLMVLLSWPRLTRRDWAVVGSVALFACVDLVAIEIKVREYGTLYPQAHTAAAVSRFLRHLALYETVGAALPVLITLLVVLFWIARPREWKPAAVVLAGVLLLVLPQTYLVAGTSPEGRYLYPLVLSMVLLGGYVAWLARRSIHAGFLSVLLAGTLALPLIVGSASGRSVAEANVQTAADFQETVRQVEQAARGTGARTIVIEPSDPYWDFEPISSYAAYLTAAGFRVVTLPAPAPSGQESTPFFSGLARSIDQMSAHGSRDLQPMSQLRLPCVSIVWAQPARQCSVDISGFDGRPS